MSNFISLITILSAMMSIQFGASVAKKLFPIAGVAGTTMLRVTIAAIILLLIWKPWKINYSKKNYLIFLGYGISLGAMNLLFYLSLNRIPLGIAVALEFTGPLTLALLSSKKILDIVWAILAATGVWLILPVGDSTHSLDLVGTLLAILAGAFWALYIIFGKASGKNTHSGHATALGMMFAALVTIPFGLYHNARESLQLSILPMGILIALLSSAIPYSLEMIAMKKIPAKTFGILMSMEPAVASLMGFLFLKENLTALQCAAIACIIIASAGTVLSSKELGQILN